MNDLSRYRLANWNFAPFSIVDGMIMLTRHENVMGMSYDIPNIVSFAD